MSDTCNGSGIILSDVGINITNCKFDRNIEHGIVIDSSDIPMPVRILQYEVKEFLKRKPMKVVIQDCEIYYNNRNGIFIRDFWKGPVIIHECLMVGNQEYGLCAANKTQPILQQDDVDILSMYQSSMNNNQKVKKNKIMPDITESVSGLRTKGIETGYMESELDIQTDKIKLLSYPQDNITLHND